MTPANERSATQARVAMERGEFSACDLLAACLDRIDTRDGWVKAWRYLDDEGAVATAKDMDRRSAESLVLNGPLYGLPLGIKDIIDTADMSTTYGSAAYPSNQTTHDAACVSLVRAAGGIPLGKTVTTEFAYFEPGNTTNPHNPDHTPGGSSSGSAAAVADFMVPLAFGTQTGGSVIRPASYCGVVGYKATYGALPMYGVKALAHDLDTLGWFCREVADIDLMRAALIGAPIGVEARQPRIGLCRTHEWEQADPDSQAAVLNAARSLETAGAKVCDVHLPTMFADLTSWQKIVMAQNAARDLSFEYNQLRDRLSSHVVDLIEQGLSVDFKNYQAALAAATNGRFALGEIFQGVDVLLCPSAPGEAPEGLESTGDPIHNRMWTLLGNPCINLPGHLGAHGLPVGVQAVGAMGSDENLIGFCKWMERKIV